jgi:nucleoside-diphosphate-sugar epimerase
MIKAAILGATGPTGYHLARALHDEGQGVRVVSRSHDNLARNFPEDAFEKSAADVLDADATTRAVEGCDLVYDCIGLPGDQMHLHPATARNVADAVRANGARCIHVSSGWAYMPMVRERLDETHPRTGGPPWVRWRREAEDILFDAGAAVLHLPDFYGPHVHVSTLQNALLEAATGKTMNWIGGADVAREYIFVPDAMRIASRLAGRTEPFGGHWILPGAGPLTGAKVAEIASRHLGRRVRLRAAGLTMLRLVSLFSKDLRGLMQVAPDYIKPISYDAGKLASLIGKQNMTDYETGIGRTLDWIGARRG